MTQTRTGSATANSRSEKATGFPPVADPDSRILILGSMPGAMSLARRQYYAQPRNAFWPIMGKLVRAGPDLPYHRRLARLREARIALWDVLATCVRPGSLDADIDRDTAVVNDFCKFFASHKCIRRVFFNGATAETLFVRRVLSGLEESGYQIKTERLPSTSPAHAAMSFEQKLDLWSAIIKRD